MTEHPVIAQSPAERIHGIGKPLSEVPPTADEVGFLSRIAPAVDIASKMATVAVLGLAFWQYYEAGQDKKRERSLQLVSAWVDDGQPERIARVSAFLYQKAAAARAQIEILPEIMREKAWENANERIFLSLVTANDATASNARVDIDNLFRFFVRVEICVSSGLCDANVARDYFLIEAQSLTTDLAPFLALVRESGLPNYGKAVEAFVSQVMPK
jgi:hypothetical protein